jgi:hypothetical protein
VAVERGRPGFEQRLPVRIELAPIHDRAARVRQLARARGMIFRLLRSSGF